ncbi:hypothetical protein [Streptomyces sp. NPDC047000]|uniref:hypothetical protein n=1 Tax=Streptomyces sp. NPDC047000 TaxID=3155474 RepID=UPI0033F4699D
MGTSLESPQPSGDVRWVALFHDASAGAWIPGAESPYEGPVRYAVGEMTQTLRARRDRVTVALWGPKDGAWHRYDAPVAPDTSVAPGTSLSSSSGNGAAEPARLAERMTDRRHQVLMAGLSKAGLYDLVPDDEAALGALVERLDETTVRRVAHWLATAAAR